MYGVVLLFKESTSARKSESEDVAQETKAEEKEKFDMTEVSSPSADETNLDFVKYTCDTRKTAMKEGSIITISSVTQSRVRIDGFTSGRNMLGKQAAISASESQWECVKAWGS